MEVGDKLWFYAGAEDDHHGSDQPMAAVVAYVNADGSVNLGALRQSGDGFHRVGVPIWDGQGEAPATAHARWPAEPPPPEPPPERMTAPADQPDPRAHWRSPWPQTAEPLRDRAKAHAKSAEERPGEQREDGQAPTNVDHGPPRSWGQSPNAGGPLEIDPHKPRPTPEQRPDQPPAPKE